MNNRHNFWKLASIAIVCLLSLNFAWGQSVTVTPTTLTWVVGNTYTVNVVAAGFTGLKASHVSLDFSHTEVQYATAATNGGFFSGGDFFASLPAPGALVDNVVVDQAVIGTTTLSGGGTLFTLQFKAISAGSRTISVTVNMRDALNQVITTSAVNATVAIENPVPATTSLSPWSKIAGDADFDLTVTGTGFVSTSVIKIDGSNRTTTYVDATHVKTTILSIEFNVAGTHGITVFNPTPGGGTSSPALTFTVNPGEPHHLVFVQQPTDATAGVAIAPAVTVQLKDALGNNVPSAGVSVAMALTTGSGALSGTTPQLTGATGLATFSDLSINLTGSKNLTALSGALTSAVSTSFTINAAAATQLVFVQQPTDATAGVAIAPAVTVQLKDALGNNVPSAGVSVAMALTTGSGALSGTTPQLTGATGLATFSDLSINLTGSKNLTASSGALTSAVSTSFTINAAAATQLVFVQQPTDATAGVAIAPAVTVQLKDALGNNVPSAGVSVAMALTTGSGALSGTTPQLTGATGLATFSDLSINLTGSKNLTALSGALTSAVSTSFTINAAAATQLVFVQQPTDATAGVAIAPAVTVQLKDALGNNVPSAGVSVAMALTTGSGALSGTTPQLTGATGLATFSDLSINLTGSKNLTASSGALTSAVSTSFTINAAAATQLVFVQQPTDATAGVAIAPAVTVQLKDALGNNVPSAGVSVAMALTTGSGALSGTTPQLTGATGLATFSDLSINLTGSKNLTALSGALTSAVSTSFTINAAAATQLVFVQQPTDATAGVAIAPAVTVQLKDALGNNVPSAGVSVAMALTTGSGALSGTTPQLTGATGLATFSDLSINLTGSKNLTALSGALTSAVSTSFTINAAAATQLVFVQQPTDATAGVAIAPAVTVQLKDALGNNVPSAGVSVAMALTTGSGALSGTTPQLTGATGLATFSDLSINLTGSKNLTALSGALTSAVSTSFTINAAAATQLVFVQQPTDATAGVAIAPAVTVQLKDALGNNVPSAGVSVAMALTTGSGALSGTTPQLTGATGLATFSDLSINLTGSKNLTALSGALTSAVSTSFTINAAAVHHFVIGTISSPQVAGTGFNITVTAQDQLNNTVTGFAGPVSLTTNAGSITPTTSGSFGGGVLTQLVTLSLPAGSGRTVSVDDGSSHTGSSNSFTVNAAPTIYLSKGPLSAQAGVFYPNTTWGNPTGYGDDWSWTTGTMPFSVYIVPEPGMQFNDCSVTLTWDDTKVTYIDVEFGASGSPNGLFGTGHTYSPIHSVTPTSSTVTITGSRADANFSTLAGDYIAKVNFRVLKPGGPTITVSSSTFNRLSPATSVAVQTQPAKVKAYLGDVASPGSIATTGDGIIDFEDLVPWSTSYWSGVPPIGMANYKLKYDIGPTQDGYVFTLPVPDGKIQFEDLIIFSISYGLNISGGLPKAPEPSKDPVEVSLGKPVLVGNETRIPLMVGGGFAEIRGMKIEVDGIFGSFLGADKGDLLNAYDTPVLVLSKAEGRKVFVDFAVMGLQTPGLNRSGCVVWLRFEGRTFVKLNTIEARSSYNTTLASLKKKGEGEAVPTTYALQQNYPNPFNPTTTIEYEIPVTGQVTLDVYNILGERMVTLVNDVKDAGFYQVLWDGRDENHNTVATGVYLYRVRAGDFTNVKKMMLLK